MHSLLVSSIENAQNCVYTVKNWRLWPAMYSQHTQKNEKGFFQNTFPYIPMILLLFFDNLTQFIHLGGHVLHNNWTNNTSITSEFFNFSFVSFHFDTRNTKNLRLSTKKYTRWLKKIWQLTLIGIFVRVAKSTCIKKF